MKGYGQKRYLQKIIGLVERDDPSTIVVVLNGFEVTDAKLAVLAMALVNNTHVRRLHLDGNAISDHGAGLLAYALQQNSTIEFVSLNDNSIRSAGAEAIATALCENETLRTLRMANNSIGNHGARGLRKMMRRNESIAELVLDGNMISKKMAGKFDDRCEIQRAAANDDAACDITAASTAGSDASSRTGSTGAGRSTAEGNEREPRAECEDKGESSNDPEGLEWAASSALSLFGASLYMDNDDAMRYIIGHDVDSPVGADSGLNSSWNNLASYMMNVQSTIDRQEREEAHQEHCENEDEFKGLGDDDLSVASESDGILKSGQKQKKKKKKKKWSDIKKTLIGKKIHAPKYP